MVFSSKIHTAFFFLISLLPLLHLRIILKVNGEKGECYKKIYICTKAIYLHRACGGRVFVSALQLCACLRSGVEDREPGVHDFND